ncbi:hypothetical protein [Roseobacter litoralis]|nr:hypothetical protein [Roseobacter litoralis]
MPTHIFILIGGQDGDKELNYSDAAARDGAKALTIKSVALRSHALIGRQFMAFDIGRRLIYAFICIKRLGSRCWHTVD